MCVRPVSLIEDGGAAAAVDPTDDGLNGFGGGRRRDDDEETAISGRPQRKGGYMNMIAPPSHLMPRHPCSRTAQKRTTCSSAGESFNLSGGANSK